jgi:arylsulfatase A-like enzyme
VRVPTFAYWKGVIKPRRSEGLFDQADLLPTFVSLAGKPGAQLAEYFPKTTYIDGVDQSGLLLADNGEAARRERIYTLNQYFAMSSMPTSMKQEAVTSDQWVPKGIW